MINRRQFVTSLAAAAVARPAVDELAPWEGGASYYRKWKYGPPASPDFFPISVWLQDPRLAARYKAIGINLFVGLWKGPTEAQLEALDAAGMPAMASLNQTALESPRRALLRGWTMMDEPDNAQALPGGGYGSCVLPSEIAATAAKMREQDSASPIYLNLGQTVINPKSKNRGSVCGRHDEHYPDYIRAADIVSYDVYPVNGDLPMWYVGAGVRRLREWAGYSKPVWNWIETTSIRGARKPTPAQITAQVWMSIINGSMGIGYFCHQFKPTSNAAACLSDPETSAALAAVNRRITSLAAVLNTPPVANGVTVVSQNPELPVEWMLKRHGGKTYLFAVGVRPDAESTVEFTLRDCGGLTAQVLGEDRTIQVAGGVFHDKFSGYQPHIYELPFVPSVNR